MSMKSQQNRPSLEKPGKSVARDLSRLRRIGRDRPVTLQEASHIFADRSAPLLLLFLGLLGLMPSPGLPIGFIAGLLIITVAFGMLVRPLLPAGPARLRLPGILGRQSLPSPLLRRFMSHAIPGIRKLERHFRPRLTWLVGGFGLVLAMLGIILQAIGLALPIPFANAPFAIGIILIALGLLTRDGLGVLAGQALGLIAAGFFLTMGIAAVRAGTSLADLLPW
ncbi:MAG: exopolysaccharide biosynthesis protein [Ferrovibrio sp.]|nr:exopolysaccharide biosynthesis protein [Ferrovibrio sp.]